MQTYFKNQKKKKKINDEQNLEIISNLYNPISSEWLKAWVITENILNLINNEIFNVGFENKTVFELANLVKENIGEDVNLKTVPTDDNRSYHISSEKIRKILNFEPQFKISNAIIDLRKAFEKKLLPNSLNDKKYFNIHTMKNINLK